jgi:hypothetical protein
MEKFYLVVSPIHLPLGDIKVLSQKDSDRTWSGFMFGNDTDSESFFVASISVAIEDGRRALF